MHIEILQTPIRFHLHGKAAAVPDTRFADVGMQLMNEMWSIVKQSNISTTGINHWVYLTDGRMFVGVEILKDSQIPTQLDALDFELQRYLKHIHIGPYQALPEKWQALKLELADRGETITAPSLEIYGHPCDDASQLETTILIGLQGDVRFADETEG